MKPVGEEQGSSLPYVPGIDGLRALAVLAVLFFHLEFDGFGGGFLGVSLFFTLSGFLITQLILREFENTGRLSLTRFWGRRFRRLMPAALVALSAVAVLSLTTDVFDGRRLRGDLLAGVGYAANWRFAFGSQSYSDLFSSASSPIQHFWSLAIEEQFYVVFPVLMAFVLWMGVRVRNPRRTAITTLVVLVGGSVVANLVTRSHDVIYYGTHTRAVELLIGALLAFALPIGRDVSRKAAQGLAAAGSVSLIVFGLLVVTVSTTDDWLYRGGLAAFSVVSAALIVGALVPGPLHRLLSFGPLVRIGKISYGIYVFHWPIIVALDADRLGFSGWKLNLVRIVATLACASASARWIENPIRRRRVLARPRTAGVAGLVGLSATAILVATVSTPAGVVLAGLDAPDQVVAFGDGAAPVANAQTGADTTGTEAELRIVIVGSGSGVADKITAALPNGTKADIVDLTQPGCAIRPSGDVLDGCEPLDVVTWGELEGREPDIVVLSVGAPERILLRGLIGERRTSAFLEHPELVQRPFRVVAGYARDLTDPFAGAPLLIWDGSVNDALQGELADIDARDDRISMVVRPDATELASAVRLAIDNLEGLDRRTRVMVIGDSTSYGVAGAIDSVAGDAYDVLWAGGRNCPIVSAVKVRWWPDMEFDVSKCPSVAGSWTTLMADFDPRVLIIVVSVPEQSEQQYEDGGDWYSVGDDEFDSRHFDAMKQLIDLAAVHGTRVVLFDSPPITSGSFAGADFADRRRVRGWNRMLQGFADTWPEITMIDWAAIVNRAETGNGGDAGGLREDGVHMSPAALALLAAGEIVPRLSEVLASSPAS